MCFRIHCPTHRVTSVPSDKRVVNGVGGRIYFGLPKKVRLVRGGLNILQKQDLESKLYTKYGVFSQ